VYFVVVPLFVFIYEGIWSGLKPGPARPGYAGIGWAETVDHGSYNYIDQVGILLIGIGPAIVYICPRLLALLELHPQNHNKKLIRR